MLAELCLFMLVGALTGIIIGRSLYAYSQRGGAGLREDIFSSLAAIFASIVAFIIWFVSQIF